MGLIERILEKVITDHAGQFLKINSDQLKTSLLKGEVVLTNVEIKTEALAEMMKMLPLRVKSASIKLLKAKVPWNELNSKSVKIHVSGVELVLEPQKIDETAAGDSWADVVKRQRLLAAEMLLEGLMETDAEERALKRSLRSRSTTAATGEGQEEDQDDDDDDDSQSSTHTGATSASSTQRKSKMTLIQRIVARIVDNLGITIDGLSIRYEADHDMSFAVEAQSIQLFTVASSSAAEEAVFVDRTVRGADTFLRRRLKIAGLAVAWRRGAFHRRDVLSPFGVGVTVVQHFGGGASHQQAATGAPQFQIEARTEGRIELNVAPEQVADLTLVVERITAHDDYVTRSAILKLRPTFSVGVDPAAWWRYAIKAHMIGMRQAAAGNNQDGSSSHHPRQHQQQQQTSWPKVVTLIQQRHKYVALYKQKLILEDSKFQSRARKLAKASSSSSSYSTSSTAAAAAAADRSSALESANLVAADEEIRLAGELLRELEILLPFRTIMLFRSFADAEFQSERAKLKKLHRSQQISARAFSAIAHGASSMVHTVQQVTAKRKTLLKSLSVFRGGSKSAAATAAASSTPQRAPSSSASSSTAATATAADQQPQQQELSSVDSENEAWMLSTAEKQLLYESVAMDPNTAWLLDETSFGTAKTRMGLAPASFELCLVIPRTCLHLLSGSSSGEEEEEEDEDAAAGLSFFDVDVGEIKIKLESFGQCDIVPASRANVPLWAVDLTLASMEFLENALEYATAADGEAASAAAKNKRIPGSFTTLHKQQQQQRLTSSAAPPPLIQLALHSTYLGFGQLTRLRANADIQATQLVVSFPLVQRLACLVQPMASAPIPAMTSRVQALREYGARRAALAKQSRMPKFDVKIEWTLPSILLPISQHHTLELALGKFRARSSASSEATIDAEITGVRLQLRRLQIDKDGHWGLLQAATPEEDAKATNALMSNINLECKLVLEPSVRVDAVCVTGISLRLPSIEPHWNAIGKTLAAAMEVRQMMPAASASASALSSSSTSSSSSSAALWKPTLAGSFKIPKVEVYVAMIPGPGWIKVKTEHVEVQFATGDARSEASFKLSRTLIKDDVQQAGEHFKDLVRIDGAVEAKWTSASALTRLSVSSDVTLNWNPTTMTRLVAFVAKNLVQRKERIRGLARRPRVAVVPAATAAAAASFPHLEVSFPHTLLVKLNQEALGGRFGICRLHNISASLTQQGQLGLQVGNFSLYGMQWLPLSDVRGVQLFGSDLHEELARKDNILELEMDLAKNEIDVHVHRLRFLWAHTLTKQFADYLTDGVAGVFAPLVAAMALDDDASAAARPTKKPNLQIRGMVHSAHAVCPAQRFGREYLYNPDVTDEIVLHVHEAPLHILVHPQEGRSTFLPTPTCNASPCGSDATQSRVADNTPHAVLGGGGGTSSYKLAVEIKIDVPCGDLYAHHKRKTGTDGSVQPRRLVASGFTGKLLWRILEFSPEQAAARRTFQSNTARERARRDFCLKTLGGSGTVPTNATVPGELPKGVSAQKFEMLVDVNCDNTVFDFALQDVHLIALVVFENIADHRRRIARVKPPKLPLFDGDDADVFASERGFGHDELANGNFGPTTVIPYETSEESVAESDAHDFSGDEGHYMVDLEMFLNIPLVKLALSIEPGSPAVVEIHAHAFQMSLTEFYNRSQAVELGLDAVDIFQGGSSNGSSHRKSLLTCGGGVGARNPATLRQLAKLPTAAGTAPSTPQEILPRWEYVRQSKPVAIVVTKFPAKDKRVEIGLERLQLNMEFDAMANVVRSLEGLPSALAQLKEDLVRLRLPGGRPDGPRKLPRALVLELFCNQLVVKRDGPTAAALHAAASAAAGGGGRVVGGGGVGGEEVALQGSARVLVAINRAGETRGLVEGRLGLVLKCVAPEAEVIMLDEQEEQTGEGVVEEWDGVLMRSPSPGMGGDPQQQQQQQQPAVMDLRTWLESVYRRKNPPKLADVDSILRAFAGNEAELIRSVSIKYDEVFVGGGLDSSSLNTSTVSAASSSSTTPKRPQQRKERRSYTAVVAATATPSTGDKPVRKMDVALVDPFLLRIDVNSSASVAELQCIVDPIVMRVTSGNVDLIKAALTTDGSLGRFAEACSGGGGSSKRKKTAASPPQPSSAEEEGTPAAATPSRGPAVRVTGLVRAIECTLLNDFGNSQSLPLVRATLVGLAFKLVKDDDGLVANMGIVSSSSSSSTDVGGAQPLVRLDHFNPRLMAWEPLLEPWEFALTVHANKAVEFTSKTPLNVNFSYAFAEAFANWIAWRSASVQPVRSRNHVTDHYIVNESGLTLRFGVKDQAKPRRLETGRRAALGYTSSSASSSSSTSTTTAAAAAAEEHGGRHGDFYRDPRKRNGLAIGVADTAAAAGEGGGGKSIKRASSSLGAGSGSGGGGVVLVNFQFLKDDGSLFASLQRIPIDTFGTQVYGLGTASKIMVHVSLENGSKVVRVRSPLHIQNHLTRAVDVLLVSPSGGCWALGPLPPDGALFPVPVDRLTCKLSMRPVTPPDSAYNAPVPLEQLSRGVELEAEAGSALMRQCDENGYAWGPSLKLADLHSLVDRPLAMLFERSKSYAVAPPRRSSLLGGNEEEDEDGGNSDSDEEEEIGFVQQQSRGFGTQFSCLVGVRSLASVDQSGALGGGAGFHSSSSTSSASSSHVRENYIVGLHPCIRVENRLPCDLFCRSLHFADRGGKPVDQASSSAAGGGASSSPNMGSTSGSRMADVPLAGGRVRSGEDLDFHHIKLGRRRQQLASSMQILHDAHVVSDELWLSVSLPNGFDWSVPFRPTDDPDDQFVMVPRMASSSSSSTATVGGGGLRLLLESEYDERSGAWNVVVFVQTWLVNDARLLVPGLQLRESGLSGEEYLHDFKDRAHSMYEKLAAKSTAAAAAAATATAAAAAPPLPATEQEVSLFTEGRNVVVRFLVDQAAENAATVLSSSSSSCSWSNVLMLDAVGSHADVWCDTTVDSANAASKRKFVAILGVSINVAPNVAFRRSRVVTFSPRLVFVNSTGRGTALYVSSGPSPTYECGTATTRVERTGSLLYFDPKSLSAAATAAAAAGEDGGGSGAWAHSKRLCPVLRLAVERADGTRMGWSGPFQCIDSGGEFTLKLTASSSTSSSSAGGGGGEEPPEVMVVRIRFEERDACTVVFVEEESATFPIYRIVNHTDEVVEFCQDKLQGAAASGGGGGGGGGDMERLVGRGTSRPFGWMEPNLPGRQVRLAFPSAAGAAAALSVNLDELSAPTQITLPASAGAAAKSVVWASVRIRGMTKTLVITDQPPPAASSKHDTTTAPAPTAADADAEILTLFRIELSQVGLSIIDRAPQELLYLSLLDSVVEFSRTRSARLQQITTTTATTTVDGEEEIEHLPHVVEALELTVGRFQIDNQLDDAEFQILLGQAKLHHASAAAAAATPPPMAQIKLVRRRFPEREEWFDYVELARFELAELDCKVEDTLLLLLGRMAWDCAMSLRSEEELVSGLSSDGAYSRLAHWLQTNDDDGGDGSSSASSPRKFTVRNWLRARTARAQAMLEDSSSLEKKKQGKKIYFAVLHILPLCMNLSFRFTATDPIAILTLAKFRAASQLRGDDGLNDGFDADQVSKSLPPALINIDSARLRLLALYATHVLGDRQALFKTIAKHYTRQAITQVYYILGSSDLIGNPLGIVVGVAKGVNELVFHPMQGITNASPVEFVQGVGKGSVSFVRHVLSGTLDSFSKLSGALGAGVALLSLDQRFVSNRWENLREHRDQSMTGVLTTSASALAYSLVDGAGGVIYRPFLANSPIEFVQELGKGLVGLAVKPVVGLLDLASRTTHGVSATLLNFDSWLAKPTERVRLPRAFRGFDRRLDPYSAEDALVTLLIKQLEHSDGVAMDYLAHAFIDSSVLLVSAGQRLWCLHCVNRRVSKVWHLPLDAVDDVQYTKEPDFPAVRICFVNPSSFVRLVAQPPPGAAMAGIQNTSRVRRGGAFDVELIIGGQVGLETQAMLAFHVDSFAKAKSIAYRLRKSLHRRRPPPPPPLPVPTQAGEEEETAAQQPQPPLATRRTLGLMLGPIPRQMRYLAGGGHVGGIAVVLKVVPGSCAADAGLQEGDILLTCDGQALDHSNPKDTLLKASLTGKDIVLRVKRKQHMPSQQFVLKA